MTTKTHVVALPPEQLEALAAKRYEWGRAHETRMMRERLAAQYGCVLVSEDGDVTVCGCVLRRAEVST